MNQEIKVLDHGFVRLDAHMADDLSVINSARVSFGKRIEEFTEAEHGLVKFLMRNHHETPFEHSVFRWHLKTPIFVAREIFRHRIGSFNELSGRYTELPEEFYVPDRDDIRSQVGKPGSYTFERIEDDKLAEATNQIILRAYRESFADYQDMLDNGVAKEIARIVLPVGIYTEFYWTLNARALMNFLKLRNHSDAQREIRAYSKVIEDIFAEKMPVTHAAFREFNPIEANT